MPTQEILTKGILKYRVNEELAKLTEESRVKVKNKIKAECTISDTTLSRYLNIKKNDTQSIPSDTLRVIAERLNVPMEKLFN